MKVGQDSGDNSTKVSGLAYKTERVQHRVYADRDQARRDLFGYIEGFYNPRSLHSVLGYISPPEAERRAA